MKYLLAFLLALAAAGQTPPTGPASISGVVKEATTRAPLEGIRVYAGNANATTGSQGEFVLQKLEPGRHWVSVYDSAASSGGGAFAVVKPGENVTGFEIFIVRAPGTISGRILDENRRPVAGAAVVLLEPVFEFGKTAYRPRITAMSNKRGEYRLQPVPAKRDFILLAKKPIQLMDAAELVPLPVFYPASADVQGAQTVNLDRGEERRGVDIQMPSDNRYCIGGTVEGAAAVRELTIGEVMPLVSRISLRPVTVPVTDGKFRACGLHPGDYQLKATGNQEPGQVATGIRRYQADAFANVTIGDRDIDDVKLLPAAAVSIHGDAVMDSAFSGKAGKPIRVGFEKSHEEAYADDVEPSHLMVGVSYGNRFPVPGAIELGSIPPDNYTLKVSELQEGCYLKAATLGNISAMHQLLHLDQTAEGRLHLVLACDGGSLRARVTDRDGNAVSNLHLYVMPEDAATPGELAGRLHSSDIENGWSETVKPLPPGRYLVLASGVQLDGTAAPILELWQQRANAKPVEVGPGEAAQVTVEISGY